MIDMNDVKGCAIGCKRGLWSFMMEEFSTIFTDSGALLLVVFATMIYTIIYSIAYGREVVDNVVVAVVDDDNTPSSRKFINGLKAGPNTRVGYEVSNMNDAKRLFYQRDVYGIVYIPDGYEHDIESGAQADVILIMDGSHLLIYRQVLQQAVAEILTTGAQVKMRRLVDRGTNAASIGSIVEPIDLNTHILYNPSLGYGSFVMPSIMIVVMQQTIIIGLAMVGVRRRREKFCSVRISTLDAVRSVIAKILVYCIIYAVNLTVILGVVWPLFGFPYAGNTMQVIVLLLLYLIAISGLGLAVSHLFVRREAPLMLLLWSSVPVLLLAGVSYPKEAFPEWLSQAGRLLPSSSAVNAYVGVGTMGASLRDVSGDVLTLVLLAILYTSLAVIVEYREINRRVVRDYLS